MKLQHWRGVPATFALEGAPVLEFVFWEHLETTKIRPPTEGWDPVPSKL